MSSSTTSVLRLTPLQRTDCVCSRWVASGVNSGAVMSRALFRSHDGKQLSRAIIASRPAGPDRIDRMVADFTEL